MGWITSTSISSAHSSRFSSISPIEITKCYFPHDRNQLHSDFKTLHEKRYKLTKFSAFCLVILSPAIFLHPIPTLSSLLLSFLLSPREGEVERGEPETFCLLFFFPSFFLRWGERGRESLHTPQDFFSSSSSSSRAIQSKFPSSFPLPTLPTALLPSSSSSISLALISFILRGVLKKVGEEEEEGIS